MSARVGLVFKIDIYQAIGLFKIQIVIGVWYCLKFNDTSTENKLHFICGAKISSHRLL